MSSDTSSDQSSVRDGAGYDEVFGSCDESGSFSWSSERKSSAWSPDEEVGSHGNEGQEEVVDEGGDVEEEEKRDTDGDEGDEEAFEGISGSPGGSRPFILPEEWAVNKFLPKMNEKVFKELCTCFQIPNHIFICLPRKNEKCYTGRTADVGMYDAMFAAGLKLPLTALHH